MAKLNFFLSFKTCNPHPIALFTMLPLIFPCITSFKNSMLHKACPLNIWQMKVKTGLQSNPSRLFVFFGHWENSDVVLPCWRGRQLVREKVRVGDKRRWRKGRKSLSLLLSSNESQ